KVRGVRGPAPCIRRWYFEGSVPGRGDGGCGGGFSGPRLYAPSATAPPRRAEKSCDVRERAGGVVRIRRGPGSEATARVRSRRTPARRPRAIFACGQATAVGA